jgi:hypothetical protein
VTFEEGVYFGSVFHLCRCDYRWTHNLVFEFYAQLKPGARFQE